MQDERIGEVARDEARWDHAVLGILVNDEYRLWSVDEIVREAGDRIAVEDAIGRLFGAGLLHRLESFVFATRAAVRAWQLPH